MISFVLYVSFKRGGALIVFAFGLQSGNDGTKFNTIWLPLTYS